MKILSQEAFIEIANQFKALFSTVQNKVDKIEGKGLSSNDFETRYKETLEALNYKNIEIAKDQEKESVYKRVVIKNKESGSEIVSTYLSDLKDGFHYFLIKELDNTSVWKLTPNGKGGYSKIDFLSNNQSDYPEALV